MKLDSGIADAFGGSFKTFCPPPPTYAQIAEELRIRVEADANERQPRANLLCQIFPHLFTFDPAANENPFVVDGPSIEDYF